MAGRPLGAGEPFRPAVAGLATEALCQAFYQYTILAREQVRSGDVPRDDEYPDWEEWQAGYLDTEFEGLKVGDRIKLASEGEIVYGHGGLAIRFDDTPPNVRPEPLDGQYLGLLRRVAR